MFMKVRLIVFYNLLLTLFLLNSFDAKAQCEEPLSLDWIQSYVGSSCTDKIYAFVYNNENYIYATSTQGCIAADASNTLYNCNTGAFCYIFGFTPPSDQCNADLEQQLSTLLTDENVIYPTNPVTQDCSNPLFMDWLSPLLDRNCTDGVYSFQHLNTNYLYRSTACEYVDDPNYLYNCATAEICYVQGRTLPELQCDLTEFPLENYLIRDNLIWSTPLLNLVKDFPWLTTRLNIKNCANNVVSRYNEPAKTFVAINSNDALVLYDTDGEVYCTDRDNLDCLSTYNLNEPTSEWACNAREQQPTCEAIDADNLPAWLSETISTLSCECGGEILQYCYNNETYISYEANAPFCADYAGFVYSEDGTQICQNGGFTGGDCFTILPNFFEEATLVNDLWACEETCEPIDADNLPQWLNNYINELADEGCECDPEILQYCYNNETYISHEYISPACNSIGFVFDENGTQVCINGGINDEGCNNILPNFFEEATLVNDLWTCNKCSQFAFTEAYLGCSNCCEDLIYFSINDTITNYTVINASNGETVFSGDPIGTISPNGNIELTATSIAGCSTSVSVPFQPFCCEVPPICELSNVFYNCEEGLQIEAFSIFGAPTDECIEIAIFEDQYGNNYGVGSIISNAGVYELTVASGGNTVSPPCGTFIVEVECENNNPCLLDAGQIVSDPNICGDGFVRLNADYKDSTGPDDNEYVFVGVYPDGSFNILDNNRGYFTDVCYYGIHYRYSCDVPNFEAETFSEILNAEANYAITDCFQVNYIDAPEYYITTEPYCDGEGMFTFGVTATGGSGSYIIGAISGQTITGGTGENFITYKSNGEQEQDIYVYDAETGCGTDYIRLVTDPGCGASSETCKLPLVSGPCEAYIPRYYFDADEGDCLQFIYGGCQGNANNFETYDVCIESCGDSKNTCANPFELEIVQAAINDTCTGAIYAFSYQNEDFIFIDNAKNTVCEFEDISNTLYNCNTGKKCDIGGLAFPDAECDEIFSQVESLIINENLIWPEEKQNCTDPYELEFVQNAINYPDCTEGIYAFNYQNEDYVYISTLCEFIDASNTLYNCNTGEKCFIGGFSFPNEECNDTYSQVQPLINDENLIWSRPCNYEHKGTVTSDPQNGCGYLIELDDSISIEPISIQGGFTLLEGQNVELSYNIIQPNYGCKADYYVNIICIREIEKEFTCTDPYELEFVQNAINYPDCTEGIYAFNYQNEDYVYISTLCEFIDASNTLYNCNTGEKCFIGGFSFPNEECNDTYSQVQPLINDENLIWSRPCNYEHKGTVTSDPQNGCGYLIELDDSISIEPISIQGGFTLLEGQNVDLSYNIIQPNYGCKADYYVNIICIRVIEEGCACDDNYEPVCGVDGNTYSNACQAECEGVEIAYSGECEEPCICPAVYEPVCGVDGNTYGNSCEAACADIEIAYEGECEAPTNEIFEQFPWLLDLVDPINCVSGLSVEVYMKGRYNYIFVKYPEALGTLYFQNGTYYCQNIRDFSCIDAYNLSDLVASWNCGTEPPAIINASFNNLICNDNGTFTIDVTATGSHSGTYGIYGTVNDLPPVFTFEEGETLTFTAGVGNAVENIYTLYVYDYYLADVAATPFEINIEECNEEEVEGSPIFELYPWLSNIAGPGNCINGSRVIEYNSGHYAFIFVESPAGNTLYYEDGRIFCDDRPNFSCQEIYELTTPTNIYNCTDQPSTNCIINGDPLALDWLKEQILNWGSDDCGLKEIKTFNYQGDDYFYTRSYPIYPYCPTDTGGSSIYDCNGNLICNTSFYSNNPCDLDLLQAADNGDLIWEYTGNIISENYSWIYDLFEPFNCDGNIIREYNNGSFAYLTVEFETGLKLYYEDGRLFCTDRENFSCVEAYDLEEVTATWTCGFNNNVEKEAADKKMKTIEESIEIFPNPNNGVFTIDFTNIKSRIHKIEIFDIAGKQHYIPVNLSESATNTVLKLNATNLNIGSYIVTVQTKNKVHSETVIIH